jgi:hypothetical protein
MFGWFKRKRQSIAPAPPRAAEERVESGDSVSPSAPATARLISPAGLEPISVPEPFRLMGAVVTSGFANGVESWTERVDLVAVLARVLEGNGHAVTRGDGTVRLDASGLVLEPQLVGMQPMEGRAVKTVTIVTASHPAIVDGCGAARRPFEYQHSTGERGAWRSR